MPMYGVEGVVTPMNQWSKQFGGTGEIFEQDDYIQKWIGRGGLGAHLSGGVCQGLSAMWISSRGDWSVFKNIIQTPGGLAHVRGFMNLQQHGIDIGSLKGRDGVTTYFTEQVRIFGISETIDKANGTNLRGADAARFAVKEASFTYLNFYSPTGGHSVAFGSTGQTHSFFDPNFGLAQFSNSNGLIDFSDAFFNTIYPTFNQDWFVIRYKAKSGA